MAKIILVVPGRPIAKQRARTFRNKYTGKVMSYTPKETVNYANLIKTIYINKYGQYKLEGALKQTIRAYYLIPKSTSRKKRELMIDDKIRPTKKPDYDNIEKICSDALESIVAFDNDNQIVSSEFNKWYSDNPRVEIEIEELNKLEEEK